MACQESAGGILACLSEHAELRVFGSHSLPLSRFPPYLDRFGRREKKARHWWTWGGGRTRDECVELLEGDGVCLCALLREGLVPCPVQH